MLTQQQIQLMILRYLGKNDDGKLHNVQAAFNKGDLPNREQIEEALCDLHPYIHLESIYEQRGITFFGSSEELPETFVPKARIKNEGRKYLEELANKEFIRKATIWGIIVGAVATTLAALI